jgi:acyl carrier protein
MVIMIEKDYGVRIENRELGEKVFANLAAMAAYIADNAPGPLK